MKMEQVELFQLLKDCSQVFRTSILILNEQEEIIRHFPETFQRPPKIFHHTLQHCLTESKNHPFQLQLFSDVFYQYFFFYPIVNKEGVYTFIGVGPYLIHEVGKFQVRKLLVLNGLDFSYEEEAIDYFKQLPVVERKEIMAVERLLKALLPGEADGEYSIAQIPTKEMEVYREFKNNQLKSKYSRHLLELNENFNRYFKQGDNQALEEYKKLRKSSLFPLGNGDELRSAKNNIITLISKLTRIAIEEGVAKTEAFTLHDFYINHLETKQGIKEIEKLEFMVIQAFLDVMKQKNLTSRVSPLVHRAKNYIFQNLTEEINLKVIADELKVNPNYLSSVFNKDTGISLTKYINEQRIKEAKDLLRETPYSLMEISIILGYNSQSYFTRVFKKQEGVSPKEFREKLHSNG
ncbi:helix-turn-helix domain-containing protein [Halobacillus sp. Marseille-Q1614]|uniref:helix-turn-helix domain-containing protein n=1 Tax=Halobacillus sp. Marseille-Q1614 TaxID=2709134 RepID=UPI00156F7F78|nr:helix-turn-helix domain-containing protein [Halobacillus sp. Marseille-Q1614]